MTPILYIKRGCSHCKTAMDYLDKWNIEYQVIDVRGETSRMQTLKNLSGQTKTPTLDWDGAVLADFGIAELEPFLRERAAGSAK